MRFFDLVEHFGDHPEVAASAAQAIPTTQEPRLLNGLYRRLDGFLEEAARLLVEDHFENGSGLAAADVAEWIAETASPEEKTALVEVVSASLLDDSAPADEREAAAHLLDTLATPEACADLAAALDAGENDRVADAIERALEACREN